MEAINGVTFRDYACACANLAGGMPLAKICEVLGIEEPVWEETMSLWNNKMAELSHEDMAFYGSVFTNPKQGKFENLEGGVEGPEVVLAKFPEWSDTIKMNKYMELAHNVGIDIDFDKEFGISITQYTQLTSHWSAYYKKHVIDVQCSGEVLDNEAYRESERLNELHDELTAKWDAFYSEKFKDQGAGIGDDIEF